MCDCSRRISDRVFLGYLVVRSTIGSCERKIWPYKAKPCELEYKCIDIDYCIISNPIYCENIASKVYLLQPQIASIDTLVVIGAIVESRRIWLISLYIGLRYIICLDLYMTIHESLRNSISILRISNGFDPRNRVLIPIIRCWFDPIEIVVIVTGVLSIPTYIMCV